MASTYSNLKIQLMATGENSGTWGNVTNTNLGTALEEAIVGSADVTFSSADVNLTLTDTNAAQIGRNLRLNLTGTVSTTQVLYFSTNLNIEKVYIINNGLAQDITVRNKIAGTPSGSSIVVPAGKTMWVYNTGTNVVDAVTHLTSLTLGSALPIASGGTGSTTATFSGANITSLNANSISSGTLAVARGGTGSATATFSGANITALNASNISTGTLAVARGGTGASTLTAENVIIGNTTGAVKFVAPGTSGNVLTSNGSVWASSAASAPAALSTASGSAPSYSARAWVNFNSVPLTGTYSQTGTTVTVTITSHGLATGQIANLDFTSGTAVDGSYTVTVTGANTFTVTQASRTTSGSVTLRNSIRASGNVSSITDSFIGIFTINFTTAMSDTYYATFITANSYDSTNANILTAIRGSSASNWAGVNTKTTSAIEIMCADSGLPTTQVDPFDVNVAIFRY